MEHFDNGGDAVLKSACSMQLEGVVSKRLDAPYRSGRSDTWLKSKCRGGQEVVIAGWTGDAAKPFRSLIAGVRRDGRLVHVGRIGTGYGAKVAAELLARLQKVRAERSPFTGKDAPKGGAGVHWVRPVLVAEIEFAGWTGDGHLRQASFKGLREDKPAADVVRETPAPLAEVTPAQGGALSDPPKPRGVGAVRAGGSGSVVMGVTLSHPDKALWPAHSGAGPVTKLDLARYYEAVAGALLPHLVGAALLDRAHARRRRRPDLLPAARHGRGVGAADPGRREGRQEALSADRPARGADRRGSDRRRGAAPVELRAGTARRSPGGWCSTWTPRRRSGSNL